MDNPNSWFYPHAEVLRDTLAQNHDVVLVHSVAELVHGDCLFILSCEKLIKPATLVLHKNNLVIHSSNLPAGKGWSPLTWQILEGKNDITSTLFEAVEAVDAGVIYLQDTIHFAGHELNDELHAAQGESIKRLVLEFVEKYPTIVETGRVQVGEESFYPRRKCEDSQLDVYKTIADQFDLLRVVDNERYPAFFTHRGQTFVVKIYKKE